MNWGLELSPKTDGFMAPARSSPSVDFVCHRVRTERQSQMERGGQEGGERERGGGVGQRLKFYTPTFKILQYSCHVKSLLQMHFVRCVPRSPTLA